MKKQNDEAKKEGEKVKNSLNKNQNINFINIASAVLTTIPLVGGAPYRRPPTYAPTLSPILAPTNSKSPTLNPLIATTHPTNYPTSLGTPALSPDIVAAISAPPSEIPTHLTRYPTLNPIVSTSETPSIKPSTSNPNLRPQEEPTLNPIVSTSETPSIKPSTSNPNLRPQEEPTLNPILTSELPSPPPSILESNSSSSKPPTEPIDSNPSSFSSQDQSSDTNIDAQMAGLVIAAGALINFLFDKKRKVVNNPNVESAVEAESSTAAAVNENPCFKIGKIMISALKSQDNRNLAMAISVRTSLAGIAELLIAGRPSIKTLEVAASFLGGEAASKVLLSAFRNCLPTNTRVANVATPDYVLIENPTLDPDLTTTDSTQNPSGAPTTDSTLDPNLTTTVPTPDQSQAEVSSASDAVSVSLNTDSLQPAAGADANGGSAAFSNNPTIAQTGDAASNSGTNSPSLNSSNSQSGGANSNGVLAVDLNNPNNTQTTAIDSDADNASEYSSNAISRLGYDLTSLSSSDSGSLSNLSKASSASDAVSFSSNTNNPQSGGDNSDGDPVILSPSESANTLNDLEPQDKRGANDLYELFPNSEEVVHIHENPALTPNNGLVARNNNKAVSEANGKGDQSSKESNSDDGQSSSPSTSTSIKSISSSKKLQSETNSLYNISN